MNPFEPLVGLVTCLCNTLQTVSDPVCWCGIYPGGVPSWDYCGECSGGACGMAYVSMVGAFPYTTFGQVGLTTNTSCESLTQLSVEMGVLRCLPIEGDGSGASADDMTVIAALLAQDMIAMREAVLCCYEGDVILQQYEALPAQGGCVGGRWSIIVDAG